MYRLKHLAEAAGHPAATRPGIHPKSCQLGHVCQGPVARATARINCDELAQSTPRRHWRPGGDGAGDGAASLTQAAPFRHGGWPNSGIGCGGPPCGPGVRASGPHPPPGCAALLLRLRLGLPVPLHRDTRPLAGAGGALCPHPVGPGSGPGHESGGERRGKVFPPSVPDKNGTPMGPRFCRQGLRSARQNPSSWVLLR